MNTFSHKKAATPFLSPPSIKRRITVRYSYSYVLKILLKVIKMLMMVVVAFSFCWLPWQSYFLLSTVYPAINQ
jgi:hypothetical protein